MPKELIRIPSGIRWLRTVIRPMDYRLATEFEFDVKGLSFSVNIDSLPPQEFLLLLPHIRCLAIYEVSSPERGWIESGRYHVRINDDDDYGSETAPADTVRWGPEHPPSLDM